MKILIPGFIIFSFSTFVFQIALKYLWVDMFDEKGSVLDIIDNWGSFVMFTRNLIELVPFIILCFVFHYVPNKQEKEELKKGYDISFNEKSPYKVKDIQKSNQKNQKIQNINHKQQFKQDSHSPRNAMIKGNLDDKIRKLSYQSSCLSNSINAEEEINIYDIESEDYEDPEEENFMEYMTQPTDVELNTQTNNQGLTLNTQPTDVELNTQTKDVEFNQQIQNDNS